MRIDVLAFAQAREAIGAARTRLELPEGSRVSDALALLTGRHPELRAIAPHLAVAVNRELVRGERELADGAELALLPPVSGG
jgi:molybdopterin converting factor subunit 1